jgi:hypothetical protein
MAYILPRAFIVLIGWGITCALIVNVWPSVDSMVFYAAGGSWAFAGLVCFGYVHKLRREAEDPHGRF